MSDSDSLTPTTDRPAFERIVAAVLELRAQPERLAPYLAREADWHLNGDPASWVYAGKRSKRESILDYLRAFNVEFEQGLVRRQATLIEGEQACVLYEMRLRHRGTGRDDVLPCLCFIRIEGDLIVEVCEFIDSASLFRLRESRS